MSEASQQKLLLPIKKKRPGRPRNKPNPTTVRVDRNLEKWPLWTPSKSRSEGENAPARVIQRNDNHRVTIRPAAGLGDLNTEDQRTLAGLFRIWDLRGRPVGKIPFTLRELSRVLKKKWGGETYKGLQQSLLRLRSTTIEWKSAYVDGEFNEALNKVYPFNILADLELATKTQSGKLVGEGGYFRFHDLIFKNLRLNYTKPVLLDTLIRFKSETAQILYTHFDLMLFGRNRFERRSKELFEDLGILSARFKYASKRKQRLEEAIKELIGVPIPTGRIKDVRIEKTVDGKDYKVVVIRGAHRHASTEQVLEERESPVPEFEHLVETPELLVAEKLVKKFHKEVASEVEDIAPSSKELEQALSLIQELGEAKSVFLIEYAAKQSRKRGLAPFAFGWLFQWKERALAQLAKDLDKRQKRPKEHNLVRRTSINNDIERDIDVERLSASAERFGLKWRP